MATRVGINGFGRIGRQALKAMMRRHGDDIVGINGFGRIARPARQATIRRPGDDSEAVGVNDL